MDPPFLSLGTLGSPCQAFRWLTCNFGGTVKKEPIFNIKLNFALSIKDALGPRRLGLRCVNFGVSEFVSSWGVTLAPKSPSKLHTGVYKGNCV